MRSQYWRVGGWPVVYLQTGLQENYKIPARRVISFDKSSPDNILLTNPDVIVGTILGVLDIKVQERDIDDVILIDLEQPFAILLVRIILRIIGRVHDPRIAGKSSTASDGDSSVTGVESTRHVVYIGQEFHEHRVPKAGVHYGFGRIADFDQQRCLLVFPTVNLQFVEVAIYFFLDLYLKVRLAYG